MRSDMIKKGISPKQCSAKIDIGQCKERHIANGSAEKIVRKLGLLITLYLNIRCLTGCYENDKRMPDIEILARFSNVLNVNADYLIGRTNTTAQKGKMKTVCEFTGLYDRAACGTSLFLQCIGLSFIDHHNILAVTAYLFSVFCRRKSGNLPELP